jgi:ABC-2 type transport system permease protein
VIGDILTMLWKEWQELLRQRGNWRGFLMGLLVPVFIFGIMFPLQTGMRWLTTPISLTAWIYMPIALVMTMMADSFAGERERHTLETLLASRLPDGAILFGKILAAVSYAIFLSLSILAVGLITVNVVYSPNGFVFYSAPIFWGGAIGGLLISFLGCGIGVLVSLHAATVRHATQTLSYVMLAVFFLPFLLLELAPAWLLQGMSVRLAPLLRHQEIAVLTGLITLILVDVILLAVARARFRRNRLMLD